MRISPKSPSPPDALAQAIADQVAAEQTPKTSPAAIDARRAQQLLERANSLAGRGDLGAAILATRQSMALAPGSIEGQLLLADLLERNRDFSGARAAYQKGVQLAPDRADARDSVARLSAYLEQSQDAARQFHFDSDELFAPQSNSDAPESNSDAPENNAAEVAAAAPISTNAENSTGGPIAIEVEASQSATETVAPALEARLPPSRQELIARDAAQSATEVATSDAAIRAARVETPAHPVEAAVVTAQPVPREGERRKHNVPVATERRHTRAAVVPVPLRPAPLQPAPLRAAPPSAPVQAAPLQAASVQAAPVQAAPLQAASANAFDIGAPIAAGAMGAAPVAARRAVPPGLDESGAGAAPLWRQVATRPSFYARTLPLVAVAVLSLGFLGWARGRAVARVVAPVPNALAQVAIGSTDAVGAQTSAAPNAPTNVGAPQTGTDAGGFPISNAPATFQAPSAQTPAQGANGAPAGNANAGNGASSTTARAGNGGSSATRSPRRALPPARPVPGFPTVSLAPAPIPPASVRSTAPSGGGASGGGASGGGSQRGGASLGLPRPDVSFPAPGAAPVRVLPPSDNGLNPAGSLGNGYIRVTEGRVGNGVIPAQPSGVARQNENSASASARNGQTDQAISQLSQAIRADGDNAGFRYQQRATLFLQRGDYSRASDDFQSAISAYQNQINRGDDVALARSGLNSARSGLNLALAGKRG